MVLNLPFLPPTALLALLRLRQLCGGTHTHTVENLLYCDCKLEMILFHSVIQMQRVLGEPGAIVYLLFFLQVVCFSVYLSAWLGKLSVQFNYYSCEDILSSLGVRLVLGLWLE